MDPSKVEDLKIADTTIGPLNERWWSELNLAWQPSRTEASAVASIYLEGWAG